MIQVKDKKGWFWYIPQHDDIVSVGVVAAYDYLFKNRGDKDHETIYFEEVARCPGVARADRGGRAGRPVLCGQGIFVSFAPSGRRRLGAGRAMRSVFSIRCIRPACCWR